ncbi:F-box protein CPR30-like [Durio zibethinus]|uniref:F-box protein CPR30-like n=1 Tax=Durio zibethinus TaxID=66656 RepID=A0A6P6B5K5_DURZI|nr:F-box protein CPR30-like [Durio zibethinus]
MSNHRIPLDVLCGILSELPVKALLRFKSVSKEWFSMINDPYFIKLHLRQSMETNRNNLNIILKERASGKLFSVGFDSINLDNPRELNHPLKRRRGGVLDEEYYDYTQALGSCNGLLCLINDNQTYRTIVLWNISTGDYKVLPDQSMEPPQAWSQVQQVTFYGFGYDSINDDYKLVMIVQGIDYSERSPLVTEVRVYSLKTNTWRRGEEIPYYFRNLWGKGGTFVNGALHWLGIEGRKWELPSMVIAFDVGTEKHRPIKLIDNIEHNTYSVFLGALRGCLCMIATCFDDKVNVWLMNDYGVKESWTMVYSFQGFSTPHLFPLAYTKNDGKLVLEKEGMTLSWYDVKRKEFKDIKAPQLENIKIFPPEICMESLVKLVD